MNPEITKIIDQYLQGELSESDRAAFEKKLAESYVLRKEVELQKQVYEAAKRASTRTQVKQTGKSFHFTRKVQYAGIAIAIVAGVSALTFLISKYVSEKEGTSSEEITSLMTKLEKESPIDLLKSEFFVWNGADSVVLSDQGVLLSIPENAFLLEGKPYSEKAVIQWQEALDGATIIKSGLSTMSGDKLLETQGMFSVLAFTPEGKRLTVNPKTGIYVQVPVDEYKTGMQLFEGKKNTEGIVDWQNPKPLLKIPVPVEMSQLDFYPSGYESELDKLKLRKDKKFRDSLYLSFEENTEKKGIDDTNSSSKIKKTQEWVSSVGCVIQAGDLDGKKMEMNCTSSYLNDSEVLLTFRAEVGDDISITKNTRTFNNQFKNSKNGPVAFDFTDGKNYKLVGSSKFSMTSSELVFQQRVKMLTKEEFKITVSSILQLDQKKNERNKANGEFCHLDFWNEWEITLNQNRSKGNNNEMGMSLFQSNCTTCHQIQKDGTGPKLQGVREKWSSGGAKEGSIYSWVRNWSEAARKDPYANAVAMMKPVAMMKFPNLSTEQIMNIFDYVDGQGGSYEISPSKVLGFWNPKFNNTNLATREFEKRMRSIHGTCNNKVLEAYTKNLNKPISEIDAQIAKMGYPEFYDFAAEQLGAVNPDNPHLKNLQRFYENAVQQMRKEVKENRATLHKKQAQWDAEIHKGRLKESSRTTERENQALEEEYELNLKNVYKQLGRTVGFQIHGGGTIYNIDKYVMDATVARASATITDPETGKTAEIVYNDFNFEVENAGEYQQVFAYLFPSGINSYQRISGENGKFNYPLNDEMTYDLAIVGISEKGYSYFQRKTIKQGNLGKISLKNVSETELNASVEQLNSNRLGEPMEIKDELDWLVKEQQNYKEQKLRQAQNEFRHQMKEIIFPCYECNCIEDVQELGQLRQ